MFTITIHTLDELQTFAARLSEALSEPVLIAFHGTLGVGKTTFIRFLLEAIMEEEIDVPSPTFTLVQTYDTPLGEVWHCDLYRLEDPEEVIELGVNDVVGNVICLVEWPEKMGHYLPKNRLDIYMIIKEGDKREIRVEGKGRAAECILYHASFLTDPNT